MVSSLTQSADKFTDADPGIAYDDTDQTWTVADGILVSSGLNDGVFSNRAGSILVNHGSILSAKARGVDFTRDNGSVTNSVGARIIGATDGVYFDGTAAQIENHGTILGLTRMGIEFDQSTETATLFNAGAISGREAGVLENSNLTGGVIQNAGSITSVRTGIFVNTADQLTTVVSNAAGATIRGGERAIFVQLGRINLDNHGMVIGDIVNDGDERDVIANHGTILGQVILGGANDLFLGTGGTSGLVDGGSGDDRLVGGGKADRLFGDQGNDQLAGAGGNDQLGGGSGNDRLSGAGGNDKLDGGSGLNTLTGGGGSDRFIFGAEPDGARNVDRIADFTVHVDKIELGLLGLGPNGVLAAARFHVGGAAADRSDRIVYNPTTGFLFYDGDGKGGHAEIHFATLAPHLALHNTDFLVLPLAT